MLVPLCFVCMYAYVMCKSVVFCARGDGTRRLCVRKRDLDELKHSKTTTQERYGYSIWVVISMQRQRKSEMNPPRAVVSIYVTSPRPQRRPQARGGGAHTGLLGEGQRRSLPTWLGGVSRPIFSARRAGGQKIFC